MILRHQVSKQVLVALLVILSIASIAHSRQRPDKTRVEPIYKPIRRSELPSIIRKGNELQASAIKRVLPTHTHPPDVKDDQLSGVVIVSVAINEKGNVSWARALTGDPMRGKEAVAALLGWKWEPTMLKSVAQKVEGKVRFDFDGNGGVSINTSDDPAVVDPRPIYRAVLLKKLEGYREELRAAPSLALYCKVAEGYFGLSRIQEAIETYKEALSRYPREITLYLAWAMIYSRQGMIGTHGEQNQWDEMQKVLELAAQIDVQPDSPVQIRDEFFLVLYELGAIYLRKERYLDAKGVLERALRLNSSKEHRDVLDVTLAQTFIGLGDKDSAMTLSQQIAERGDRNSALELLGSLYQKLWKLGDKKSANEVMRVVQKVCEMKIPKTKSPTG
jgi:TonB family protein